MVGLKTLAGEMTKVAEQLTNSMQTGSGLVKDVNVCLGAVAAEDSRDERGELAEGGELECTSSPSSRKRRRGSATPVTPRHQSKLALPTPVKETSKARRVAKEEGVLKVTLGEFTAIQDGSKGEHTCKRTAYFRNKLLKQGLSRICFFAGRGCAKKTGFFSCEDRR